MFSLSFFYLSVSASRFCLPAANEKIDDINGCPKSRSQMVSDLLSLCWQNVVNFTSVCVCELTHLFDAPSLGPRWELWGRSHW